MFLEKPFFPFFFLKNMFTSRLLPSLRQNAIAQAKRFNSQLSVTYSFISIPFSTYLTQTSLLSLG